MASLQTITYWAKGQSKKEKTKLKEVERPGFGPGATDIWLSVPIRIPEYAVSIDNCHNISVDYKIKVCIYLCACAFVCVCVCACVAVVFKVWGMYGFVLE